MLSEIEIIEGKMEIVEDLMKEALAYIREGLETNNSSMIVNGTNTLILAIEKMQEIRNVENS
jgi:hypothetical protein